MSWNQISPSLYKNSEYPWVIEKDASNLWYFRPSSGIAIQLSVDDIIAILSSSSFATDPLVLASQVTPAGLIAIAAGTIPSGWLICDGVAVSRTTYAGLFAAISTVYGAGDGLTTFNVPDIRGITPRGIDGHGTLLYADGSPVQGPALGAYFNDQMQGHFHGSDNGLASYDDPTPSKNYTNAGAEPISLAVITGPTTDGVNGAPRTGQETRGFCIGVNWMIKT